MQKLMKNWIFTLIVCILLAILTVLTFLDSLHVGDLYLVQSILNILTAVMLAIYLILALFPLLKTYRGKVQAFLMFEIVILLIAIVSQVCQQYFEIPILAEMQVCSIFGLALWLRCSVETVHAYLLNGEPDAPKKEKDKEKQEEAKKETASAKRVPLWRLCMYIVLGAVGVWQMVEPLIKDRNFGFCIAGVSLVAATVFAYATVENRKALPKKPKKKKNVAANSETTAVVVAEADQGEAK